MTLTTDIYWEVDGVALHTLAFNIETLSGRVRVPAMRGSDVTIPYAQGERFVPKIEGSRTETLAMWVVGTDVDGVVPVNRQAEFEKNYGMLFSLFYKPRRQITIKKRMWVGGSLRTLVAKGQYVGGLDLTDMGRFGGKFLVDIKFHYPWFIDETYQTFNLVNGHQNVTIPGQFLTTQAVLIFNGSRVNPEIINWTTGDNLKYPDTLVTSSRVEIDIQNWGAAYFPPTGPSVDHAPKIQASGDFPMWAAFEPGVNDIELLSTSGAGTVQLQVKGAFL